MERDGKKYLSGQCILRGLRQGGEVISIDFFSFLSRCPKTLESIAACVFGDIYIFPS